MNTMCQSVGWPNGSFARAKLLYGIYHTEILEGEPLPWRKPSKMKEKGLVLETLLKQHESRKADELQPIN
jgi:hypothetical protein